MKNSRSKLQILLLFVTLSFSLSVKSAENCLDKPKLKETFKEFLFYGSSGAYNFCNEADLGTKVIRTLQFIKEVHFEQSGKGIFNQNILPERVYSYFKKRVQKIVLEDACPSPLWFAYVRPQAYDKTIHICPHFFNASVFERAGFLMHEARHFDGYDHVNCIRGQYKRIANNIACDSSYAEKGSYAVSVEFNIKISQDVEMSPVLRNEARVKASLDLVGRFNILPGDLKDGAFLTDEKNMLSFFDGVSSKNISQLLPNQVFVSNDYLSPYIIDKNFSKFIELTWGLSPSGTRTDDDKSSSQFIDIAAGENYVCYLFDRDVRCYSLLNGSGARVAFSQIKPISIYSHTGTGGQRLLVVITDRDGHEIILPSRFEDLKNLRESQMSLKPNTANILKVQDWQGDSKKIVVTQDGRLFFLEREKWTPLFPKKNFSNVVAPVVWSQSLHAL